MSAGTVKSSRRTSSRGSADSTMQKSMGGSKHNFGNDYCDRYIRTGKFPQQHVTNVVDPFVGYPKLQRLHEIKRAHNRKYACQPFGCRTQPKDMPDKLVRLVNEGLTFDVIFIGGCLDYEVDGRALSMLPIGQITPRPSVLFLWVSNPMLEQGRQALENWGFRRSEDIVYFTMSQNSLHFPKGLASDPNDCVIKTTWHCLLGLKGTLRRSEDFDLINCNVDTDVIMQSPAERPNIVPEAIYEIIENFCLMSRRVHIIPGRAAISKPVRARPGWVIMSPDILLDNLDSASAYFQASLNPSHRIPVDAEIDALRPRTPPRHDHSFSK